uniref:Uncharacterized protein n=1 Tax=Candidatus Kentrum sp. LFY TaxID=2126342 RepID=A0A450V4B6_9GAMM|nr:MAG: hypothetical protein BECKLFY1418A_GA0070994_11022 [Candidatus Kentron sp. LFY]
MEMRYQSYRRYSRGGIKMELLCDFHNRQQGDGIAPVREDTVMPLCRQVIIIDVAWNSVALNTQQFPRCQLIILYGKRTGAVVTIFNCDVM